MKTRTLICLNCGKSKEIAKWRLDRHCSKSCQVHTRNKTAGNPMSNPLARKKASETRKRLISEGKVKVFGHGHNPSMAGPKNFWWGKNRSGKNNPRYVDGFSMDKAHIRKVYSMFEWKQNRKRFFEVNGACGCVECGINENLTVDHVVPYRVSKSHSFTNLQVLCWSCHGAKTRRDVGIYGGVKNEA